MHVIRPLEYCVLESFVSPGVDCMRGTYETCGWWLVIILATNVTSNAGMVRLTN